MLRWQVTKCLNSFVTNNKHANGLNMCRSRMFSKCYKALSIWTRSFDKCRWLSAGIIPVISVLTANPQHNARSYSFDFLFPGASANIPHMGFVARENYDTGNTVHKICSSHAIWTLYSFIVFVPVFNFKNGWSHWLTWEMNLTVQ